MFFNVANFKLYWYVSLCWVRFQTMRHTLVLQVWSWALDWYPSPKTSGCVQKTMQSSLQSGKCLGKKKMSVQIARWNVWMMFQPGKKKKRMTTQNMKRWCRRWLKCNWNKSSHLPETIRNEYRLYRKQRSKMDRSAGEERGGGDALLC